MTQPEQTTLPGERLALLVRLALDLNASLDPDEVLRKVMDEVITLTHAERGFVMLLDAPQQKSGEQVISANETQLHVPVSHGIDPAAVASQEFNVSRGVIDRVLKEGEPLLTNDAQSDSRFMSRQSVILLKLRSILCVPLKVKDRNLGIIYVDSRIQAGIFSPADLELLSVVAATAAIAIENARLYQVAVEKGRMERELQMARRVQSSLLPQQIPFLPGWEIAARWLPAREVAGDYYDFILFEDTEDEEPKIGLVIGDVADKGMASALFMAFARSTLRATAFAASSALDAVLRANVLISAD